MHLAALIKEKNQEKWREGEKKRIENGKHKLFLKQKAKEAAGHMFFWNILPSVEKVAALQINIDIFSTKNTLWQAKKPSLWQPQLLAIEPV